MKDLIKIGVLGLVLSATTTLFLVNTMYDFDTFIDITKDIV